MGLKEQCFPQYIILKWKATVKDTPTKLLVRFFKCSFSGGTTDQLQRTKNIIHAEMRRADYEGQLGYYI